MRTRIKRDFREAILSRFLWIVRKGIPRQGQFPLPKVPQLHPVARLAGIIPDPRNVRSQQFVQSQTIPYGIGLILRPEQPLKQKRTTEELATQATPKKRISEGAETPTRRRQTCYYRVQNADSLVRPPDECTPFASQSGVFPERPPRLTQNRPNHIPRNVRETVTTAIVEVSQSRVIQSHEMEHGRV